MAWDDTDQNIEKAEAGLKATVEYACAQGWFKPNCGICGSGTLRYESGRTPYQNLDEAKPHLEQLHRENMQTRADIDATRLN